MSCVICNAPTDEYHMHTIPQILTHLQTTGDNTTTESDIFIAIFTGQSLNFKIMTHICGSKIFHSDFKRSSLFPGSANPAAYPNSSQFSPSLCLLSDPPQLICRVPAFLRASPHNRHKPESQATPSLQPVVLLRWAIFFVKRIWYNILP